MNGVSQHVAAGSAAKEAANQGYQGLAPAGSSLIESASIYRPPGAGHVSAHASNGIMALGAVPGVNQQWNPSGGSFNDGTFTLNTAMDAGAPQPPPADRSVAQAPHWQAEQQRQQLQLLQQQQQLQLLQQQQEAQAGYAQYQLHASVGPTSQQPLPIAQLQPGLPHQSLSALTPPVTDIGGNLQRLAAQNPGAVNWAQAQAAGAAAAAGAPPDAAAAAAAAGLPGQQGALQLPGGPAGLRLEGSSFTGFQLPAAGAGQGVPQDFMSLLTGGGGGAAAGPGSQGGMGLQQVISSSGLSGPSSMGALGGVGVGGSDMALLQAASMGDTDNMLRMYLMKKLLAGEGGGAGGGVDVTTLLALQSLGNKGAPRNSQQGTSDDLLFQLLLQKQQAQQQQQQLQQQQLLSVVAGQQQQQQQQSAALLAQHLAGQPQQLDAAQPGSATGVAGAAAAAGWGTVSTGAVGQQGMQQQAGQPPVFPGSQPQHQATVAQLEQQQALLAAASAACAAAAAAMPPSSAGPAAAAGTATVQQEAGQQQQQPAAATPGSAADTNRVSSDGAKASDGAAVQAANAAAAATAEAAAEAAQAAAEAAERQAKPTPKSGAQPRRAAAQQKAAQQKAAKAERSAAERAAAVAAAAAEVAAELGVDPATAAAMPVHMDNQEDSELLQLADTLMSMQSKPSPTDYSAAADEPAAAAAAAMSAAMSGPTDSAAAAAAAAAPKDLKAQKSGSAGAAEPAGNTTQQETSTPWGSLLSGGMQQQQQQEQRQEDDPMDSGAGHSSGGGSADQQQQQQQEAAAQQQVPHPASAADAAQHLQQQVHMGQVHPGCMAGPFQAFLQQQQQQQQQQQMGAAELGAVPAPPPRRAAEPGRWRRVLDDLKYYLEEDIQQMEAFSRMDQPAVKRQRLSGAPEGPLPPVRTAMDPEDRQALGELLELLQERREQPVAGFWGKAWYQVQRYLSLNEDGAQQQEGEDLAAAAAAAGMGGAAAAAAAEPGSKRSLREVTSVEPAPIAQLPPAEQAALKNILEPIRKDQINKLQQRLAELAGGEVGVLPGGLAGPEAAALGQQDQVNAAAAAAAANTMMMQNMGYGNYLNDPNFWMYGGMADTADEGYGDMGQWHDTRGIRGRGGRPKGSGNRVQISPRPPPSDPSDTGSAKFSLRSIKYTGVYRSRRSQEGWRAQFCYANKVINLGTFATEEEAARVWNEAALLFRGADAWLNPVDPQLPEDYTPGELHLASDKAASAVIAAAVAAGLEPPKVTVKPH